jgi:hypothetical protein
VVIMSILNNERRFSDEDPSGREKVLKALKVLNDAEFEAVMSFVEQIVVCYDPDAVSDFLRWRSEPRLGTILQLAASLGDEALDQRLFAAEDIYSDDRNATRSG